MRRFRIRTLMGLVLLLGVGLALVARPTPIGNGLAFTVSLFAVLIAAIGAMTARDRVRTRCLGFATLGGGYLLLSLGPWCESNISPHLVTTASISHLYVGLGLGPPMNEPVYFFSTTSNVAATVHVDVANWAIAANPLIPGRSRPEFDRLVHSLLAILFGAVGAALADRFARRRDEPSADQPPSAGSGTDRGASAETIPSASSTV